VPGITGRAAERGPFRGRPVIDSGLSEEYDPKARRLVGNFPQAFSHVPLIDTARNLSHVAGPSQVRQREGSRCPRE
jgi:hypothetical protein